jgi:general secretion pathway protein D
MEVRITQDAENNTLLILATASEYDNILAALQRLDISPRQVLVEATIAEVTLTGELRYGLQWFFKNNDVLGKRGTGSLNLNTSTNLNSVLGSGFTYALSDGAGIVRAVLNTLAQDSKVRILSSPQLLVVDNQTARIRVGDQQPVRTSTTTTEGGVIIESIQFKDTGVTLEVTPHVNAGGLVTMEISQELTEVGEIDQATGQRSFLQRAINSSVVVQSGQGIVLGGLISETASSSQSGVPGLYKLPIVGPLFGSTEDRTRRTELIVLITPKVVRNSLEAQQVTNELRQRMRGLTPLPDSGIY